MTRPAKELKRVVGSEQGYLSCDLSGEKEPAKAGLFQVGDQ